jgi:hypothetical protein
MLKQVQHDVGVRRWQRALARYARAEAEIEALRRCEDDDLYGQVMGRDPRP